MDNTAGEQAGLQTGFAPRRVYDTAADAAASVVNAVLESDNQVNGQADATKPKPKISILKKEKKTKTELTMESLSLNDTAGAMLKTPVSLLQELLSRRGITPNYELVQIEGAIHQPTFRYRVSFKDEEINFTAMGAGRSKKEAKHAAAKALIERLNGVPGTDSCANGSGLESAGTATGIGTGKVPLATGCGDGDNVAGNPIGWLQEMCMTRRWPPPIYETETEVGLPHERLFTIACSILNYREVGKGKSKKIAKRLAANKMFNRLQETPLDSTTINDALQTDLEDNNNFDPYGDITNIPTLTSQQSSKVSQFHKSLKESTGKKLLKLQKTCLKTPKLDYIKMLSDIASENHFEVTYVDIEEKTINNKYQCLVQLSTFPVAVCHGSGDAPVDAQKQAAHNALEYLKIMTKK